MGLRTRTGVELARAGQWATSTGPWHCTRDQIADAVRAGKSGRYFMVLNCDSEYGLSSETWGRLWLLVMSRSTSKAATGLDRAWPHPGRRAA